LPLIFSDLPEALDAFAISWFGASALGFGGICVTAASALVRGGFIVILAYTFWLEMSRDNLSQGLIKRRRRSFKRFVGVTKNPQNSFPSNRIPLK